MLPLSLGSIFGFLAVALGAFAAHGLKERLDAYALGIFHTGAQYQMFHALALVALGVLCAAKPAVAELASARAAAWAFAIGIVVFSGSLYLLALTGQKWLGAITPLGGLSFLAGWIALFLVARATGSAG